MKNKNMYLILTMLLLFTGCEKEEAKEEQQENSIYGIWQLIEVYSGPPSGEGWSKIDIDDGYKYNINENLSFNSTFATECLSGKIELTSSEITFIYDCDGFTAGIENPKGSFKYSYKLNTSLELELLPLYLNCDEGCVYKFEKVITVNN